MKRLWWTLLVFTTGTNLATPLFPLYQSRFGIGTTDITLLFTIYAVCLLPSLLLIGPLSDRAGRKRIILPMLVVMTLASLLFAFASTPAMLFAARALQGVATGGFLGACTAFMAEQRDAAQRPRTLLLASFTTMLGFGLGPGLAGALVQYVGRDPYQMPFLLHVSLMLTAVIASSTVAETVTRTRSLRPRVAIGVPRGVRAAFFGFIAPAGFVFFALNGTVIALIPSFTVSVLHLHNLATAGGLVLLLMLAGGVAQVLARDTDLLRLTRWGLVLTAAGAFVIIAASPTHSVATLLLGMIIEGVGNGWTFKGSLALAGKVATSKAQAQVISSYYMAAYIGFSVPVFSVGLLSAVLGLTPALLLLSSVLAIGVIAIILGSDVTMEEATARQSSRSDTPAACEQTVQDNR